MAAQTGRTISKYTNFVIADSNNTLRDIPINSLSACGVATASSGYLVTAYTVDLDSMTYSASLRLYPGSSLPAWGTAAEAAS